MKKKHRRAVCKSLVWAIRPFWWLFLIVAAPFIYIWLFLQDWEHQLDVKFRTYDDDPD